MKKIIYSLLVIAVVASVAGVATYAGWNDTDTSTGNEIKAGTLELEWWLASVNDANGNGIADEGEWTKEAPVTKFAPVVEDGEPAQPGDSGTISMLVRNAGNTVDGIFTIENVNFVDIDSTTVDPLNPVAGQLSQFIDLQFQMTQDDGGVAGRLDELTDVVSNNRWHFGADNNPKDPVTLTKNKEAHTLTINWWFVNPEENTNGTTHSTDQDLLNDTMGDSVFINFTGTLTQK